MPQNLNPGHNLRRFLKLRCKAIVQIRSLTSHDAAWCAELEAELFPGDGPWTEATLLAEIRNPHTIYLGAFEGDLLVGYAGMAILGPRNEPECEIHTIGVDMNYQRLGIGARLMAELAATADQRDAPIFLEVRTDNDPAISMYKQFGFIILSIRKNYYRPSGADAYTMLRPKLSERNSKDSAETTAKE